MGSFYDETTGCAIVNPSMVTGAVASVVAPYLTLNGSNNLAVDGNGDPQIFAYAPPLDLQYFCTGISLFMVNGVSFPPEKFAGRTALPFGLTLDANLTPPPSSVSEEIVIFKVNHEIQSYFPGSGIATVSQPPVQLNGTHWFTQDFNGGALLLRSGLGGMRAIVRDDIAATGLIITIRLFGHLRRKFDE